MKKMPACALMAALALSVLAGCGLFSPPALFQEDTTGGRVIKIGVFEPITGPYAANGKQEVLGMQYGNLESPTVEIGGETYQVELVYADNASSTEQAPFAAATLIHAGVSLVLGSYGSGVSIAAGPVFDEAGIAAIGATCTDPNVTASNASYFRICFLDPFQGTILAHFAAGRFGAATAYCLGALDNDYDQRLMEAFTQTFEAGGGQVFQDFFPQNTADFTSYLNSAEIQSADVIFCTVPVGNAPQLIRQAAAAGITTPILGCDTLDTPLVLDAAADSSVQLYIPTFYQEGGAPQFDAGIKAWINSDAGAKTNNGGSDAIAAATAMGYDAYYVALEALKAAGSTAPFAVKAALPGLTYSGVSGDLVLDAQGDALRGGAYIKTAHTASGVWTLETMQTVP